MYGEKDQGWKERLLSHAGKDILMKAIAQTILTSAMLSEAGAGFGPWVFKIADGKKKNLTT